MGKDYPSRFFYVLHMSTAVCLKRFITILQRIKQRGQKRKKLLPINTVYFLCTPIQLTDLSGNKQYLMLSSAHGACSKDSPPVFGINCNFGCSPTSHISRNLQPICGLSRDSAMNICLLAPSVSRYIGEPYSCGL